jgi:hypothetical protein
MANGEQLTIFGDIRQAIQRDDWATGRRNRQALEAAMERGDIQIRQTPAAVLTEVNPNYSGTPAGASTNTGCIVTLRDGSLILEGPEWASVSVPLGPIDE